MELWMTEKHTDGYSVNWRIIETLHTEKSAFQNIAIIDTEEFGRALILDGIVQTTVQDEFIYHEMISHIALLTHEKPKKILVIGGGDGGTIREVLKHPSVEKAVLVEIDERVIEVSKKYLPEISEAINNPKAEVKVQDGLEYIKKHKNEFDIIIIDSSDPIGPAVELFARDFYQRVYEALKEDGIFVAQTESPLFNKELLSSVYKTVADIFPIAHTYITAIPTYVSGFWTFTIGSKKNDPVKISLDEKRTAALETRYYTPEIHKAAFVLPKFIKDILF